MSGADDELTCPVTTEWMTFPVKFNYCELTKIKAYQSVNSPTFLAAGYEWYIQCYPNGWYGKADNHHNYIDLFPMIQVPVASAIFDMYLLDIYGSPSWSTLKRNSYDSGFENYVEKTVLEKQYINSECCFVVICSIKLEGKSSKQVPKNPSILSSPSDIHEDLGKLLEKGEVTDVTFEVEGQTFAAHRVLLAAGSPVFKAELFGCMSESVSKVKSIIIKDIRPDVFKSMIHFIYTDSVPEQNNRLAQHLIVAADRYNIERLKLICEEILCEDILWILLRRL